ncbi:MAG: ribonuclease H-like domain-containing protein [Ignavibacteria bacterium]
MLDISNRNILVFDIETVGDDIEELPADIQTYLTKFADTEEKRNDVIEQFVFNPLTSRIAAIGMMEFKTEKGCVMMNAEDGTFLMSENEKISYLTGTEAFILNKFWEIISAKDYNLFVTFNGREFDCPFIMMRSTFHKIKPGFNLMKGSDYTFKEYHIDLLKEFTFYTHSGRGARRKFSLDFYCHKFGIKSSKIDGMSGDMVGKYYLEKKYKEIADYCISDVIAENELFKYWNEYFNI